MDNVAGGGTTWYVLPVVAGTRWSRSRNGSSRSIWVGVGSTSSTLRRGETRATGGGEGGRIAAVEVDGSETDADCVTGWPWSRIRVMEKSFGGVHDGAAVVVLPSPCSGITGYTRRSGKGKLGWV